MKVRNFLRFVGLAIAIAALTVVAQAQKAGDAAIANMTVGSNNVRWDVLVPNSGGSVLVSFPDGRSFRKVFRAGGAPVIDLSDKQLDGLPEGTYTYELLLAPVLTAGQKEAMMKARGNDDDPEAERAARKRAAVPSLVQHGSFAVVNGALVGPGAIEGERTGSNSSQPQPKAQPATVTRVSANTVDRLRNHRFSLMAFDIVHADDVIIQGSLCVGLDCVSGEVFGFDTIRLKENNTRIQFEDTSAAGFPLNNWQIRANSSAAGGTSFLAFVDQGAAGNSETGTIVFEVDAGAPANALKVASNGKVGLRTATPVLDIHMNTSDTPAMRMEQNNSGGFTAQTWDVAGNEANFFVRDVTGGSRLPFRIRPGAPTSSIDIAASGNVGIGTASPSDKLHVSGSADTSVFVTRTASTTTSYFQTSTNATRIGNLAANGGDINFNPADVQTVVFKSGGNVGIGTNAPDQKLSVQGDADKSAGGTSWGVFSDERLKDIKGGYTRGLNAVMGLRPVRFSYKKENALSLQSDSEIIGFSAQALEKVVPEAVSKSASGYLVVHSDPILWAMLNAIKEQQQQIEQLKGQIHKLQTAQRRRR
jgi:Chaperone of endosialidase